MSSTTPSRALLIFVRNPEPGKVKTRLARDVGDERALRIYLALLQHTREVALAVDAHRYLFYSNFIDHQDEWPGQAFHKLLQNRGNLGDRMSAAFGLALESRQKAVIIGSDCPQLSTDIVEEAFRLLDQHDAVIGPADDGGYYLLGMRNLYPGLFLDMPWSTPEVFRQTVHRLEQAQATYALLPMLSDVDYLEDWQQYGWPLP